MLFRERQAIGRLGGSGGESEGGAEGSVLDTASELLARVRGSLDESLQGNSQDYLNRAVQLGGE